MVGAEGFEPPTLCSQSRCATRLRYAPTLKIVSQRQRGASLIFDYTRCKNHSVINTIKTTGIAKIANNIAAMQSRNT